MVSVLLLGGLLAGMVLVGGEFALNFRLLGEDWRGVITRLALPEPTLFIALQGVAKLLLLGQLSVWLALRLRRADGNATHAALLAGGVVWFLVWFWVQWGLLLGGFVTMRIAALTVIWGCVELPLATWAGAWLSWWITGRVRARVTQ